MTKRLLITTLLSLVLKTQGQNNYKSFSDTLFSIGDKIITPKIYFDVGTGWTIVSECRDSVALIADFLKRHPKFQVEIGVFADNQGNKPGNQKITEHRAARTKDYLITEFKIDSTRIKSVGYGSSFFIIPEIKIKTSKTETERNLLHAINRRTEVKILSTN